MALNEQEEFELLSLERARSSKAAPAAKTTAAPMSTFDRLLRAARPEILSPDDPYYELGGKVVDATGSPGLGLAANLAAQTATMFVGGGLGAKLEPASQALGTRLMQSALKPDKAARDSGRAAVAVNTLLEEGVNVTRGGADILRGKVDDLQSVADSIISQYPNARVDKQRVYDALNETITKALKQGTPQSDVAIINKAVMDFSRHPLLQGSSDIPIALAQEIKQGIWRRLKDPAFGKGIVPAAERDSQKAIGSGLRQGIEDVVPAIGPVNAETKKFLDTLKLVENRAGAQGNTNLIGLGALSPSMHNFLGWMLDRYPAGKSMLARYFYTHADPEMAGRAAGAAVGAHLGQPPSGANQ